jgi:hypothetical protein
VKNSVTEKTSASARLRRQLLINSVQQSKKLGVLQQGMAHFARLEACAQAQGALNDDKRPG